MDVERTTAVTNVFVGVWKLESFSEHSDLSGLINPLGLTPVGLLIYTADGYVSAQLMKSNRIASKSDPWEPHTTSEGVDPRDGYIAYCGRYEVIETRSEVIHLPIVALDPNLVNQGQHRTFDFGANTLTLVTTRTRSNGETITSSLKWQRYL